MGFKEADLFHFKGLKVFHTCCINFISLHPWSRDAPNIYLFHEVWLKFWLFSLPSTRVLCLFLIGSKYFAPINRTVLTNRTFSDKRYIIPWFKCGFYASNIFLQALQGGRDTIVIDWVRTHSYK